MTSRPESEPFEPISAMAKSRHEFGEFGGVNMSIEGSTTFTVMAPEVMPALFHGQRGPREGCYLYGRHFNPTVFALGRQLAAMEGTEAAYCTSSGMSAIAATVMQICKQGDHAVVSNTLYGGTHAFFKHFLSSKMGLQSQYVDIMDLDAVEAACTSETRLLFVESISNPTLAVANIPKLAQIAHRHGAKLVVDNTFSPLVLSPARLGADVVVHSLTKFISGASDIIAGAICSSEAFLLELMDVMDGGLMVLGPTMDPHQAFHIGLRLPHLGIRMQEHARRAQVFAERLDAAGLAVTYPGLPGHPQHQVLKSLANPTYGAGGIFSIDFGTEERANEFMSRLQNDEAFGFMAVSLGYFETLMSCSASSTSSELSEDEQREAGISQGLVRISIGYTGTLEQRWQQMERVLLKLGMISDRATCTV